MAKNPRTYTAAEEFWLNSASSAARNPAAWASLAMSLKESADTVLTASRAAMARVMSQCGRVDENTSAMAWSGRVYMLLAGLAIENLVKGLLVVKDPSLIQPDPGDRDRLFGRWVGKGHLNSELLDQASVTPSVEERALVDRLGTFVEWAGRYPTPTRALTMASQLDSTGSLTGPANWSDVDIPDIDALYGRLLAELHAAAMKQVEVQAATRRLNEPLRHAELLRSFTADRYIARRAARATLFERTDIVDRVPGAAVGCAGCGVTFELDNKTEAALCGCGVLHLITWYFDGSLGREIPHVDTYRSS